MFRPQILVESESNIVPGETQSTVVPKQRWFSFKKRNDSNLNQTLDEEPHSSEIISNSLWETNYSSETNLADIENHQDFSSGCGFCCFGNMFACLKRKLSKKKTRAKDVKRAKQSDSPKPKRNETKDSQNEQPIEHEHVVNPSDLHRLPQNFFGSHTSNQRFDWNYFNQTGGYLEVNEPQNRTNQQNQKKKKKKKKNNRNNKEKNNNRLRKEIEKPLEIQLDPKLMKYWKNRYRLFSKYDEGIILDAESWYSVTPEVISEEIAQRCRCDVIIDGFCGAGGNTIQFAFTCERVIAIDIDENKISLAKHNAEVYGVADRIEFIVGDFFHVVPSLKADVVFLSPPWGGPEYTKMTDYPLSRIEPRGGKELFAVAKQITDDIAYYLPRNMNKTEITSLVNDYVKIDKHYLNDRVVAITAYFGELVEDYD